MDSKVLKNGLPSKPLGLKMKRGATSAAAVTEISATLVPAEEILIDTPKQNQGDVDMEQEAPLVVVKEEAKDEKEESALPENIPLPKEPSEPKKDAEKQKPTLSQFNENFEAEHPELFNEDGTHKNEFSYNKEGFIPEGFEENKPAAKDSKDVLPGDPPSSTTYVSTGDILMELQEQEEMDILEMVARESKKNIEEEMEAHKELFSKHHGDPSKNSEREWPGAAKYLNAFSMLNETGDVNPNIMFHREGMTGPALFHLVGDDACSAESLENYISKAACLDHNGYAFSERADVRGDKQLEFVSPLNSAVRFMNLKKVKVLCKLKRLDKTRGIWNLRGKFMLSPLAYSVGEGYSEISSHLLRQKDLDPNIGLFEESRNITPLSMALSAFRKHDKGSPPRNKLKALILEMLEDSRVTKSDILKQASKELDDDEDLLDSMVINMGGNYSNF